MNVITLSAKKIADLISKKEISAEEVVKHYLAQIEKINPKINAIVEYKPEEALATAKQLDAKQAKGEKLGALHGVPFSVKDIFDVKGYKTTAGSLALRNNIGKEDATFIKRLKAAGAIFIGKTNTSEFECAPDTTNDLYGTTNNPFDYSRSAGGSSGGCAAAVAANCVAFSIGADHGGSLRYPAHYNGLATIRSPGRIPSTGIFCGVRTGLTSRINSEGPLVRRVEDLNLIMNVMQGPDGVDPNVQPLPWPGNTDHKMQQLKIAYFSEDSNAPVNEDVKQTVEKTAQLLRSAGADLAHDKPARIDDGFEIHSNICGPDVLIGFKALAKHFNLEKPSKMIPLILDYFKPYQCELPEYLKRWNDWDVYRSDILKFFDKYDAFICHVTGRDALPHTTPMWDGKVNMAGICWAISSTLCPVVVVRAGTSAAGLPIGVQIVAKPGRDDIALAVAKQIEALAGF